MKTKKGTKMEMKEFKVFDVEDMMKNPYDKYFNTKEEMQVVGVRKETKEMPRRTARKIIDEMMNSLQESNELSIRFFITLEELKELLDKKKVIINNNSNFGDEIQRNFVMKQSIKGELAVSIINGDDTMPDIDVVITEEDEMIIYINDGMQRTNTIYDLLNGDLKISSTACPKLNGKTFFDLPEEIREIVEKRRICLKVGSPLTARWRGKTFSTLNTTPTKMSEGELLKTKYYHLEAFRKLSEIAESSNCFGSSVSKDLRNNNVANLIYAVASNYYTRNEGMPTAGKKAVVEKFLKVVCQEDANIMDYIDKVEDAVNMYMLTYGEDFSYNFRTENGEYMYSANSGKFYEDNYHRIIRKTSVKTGTLLPVMHTCIEHADKLRVLSPVQRRKICTYTEKYITNEDYTCRYSTDIHGKAVMARNNEVSSIIKKKLLSMTK